MKIKKGYIKTETFDGWAVTPIGEESRKNKIMLTLNKTASEIWDLLSEGKTKEEIVSALTKKYGITAEKAEQGTDRVLAILSDEGILEE